MCHKQDLGGKIYTLDFNCVAVVHVEEEEIPQSGSGMSFAYFSLVTSFYIPAQHLFLLSITANTYHSKCFCV